MYVYIDLFICAKPYIKLVFQIISDDVSKTDRTLLSGHTSTEQVPHPIESEHTWQIIFTTAE